MPYYSLYSLIQNKIYFEKKRKITNCILKYHHRVLMDHVIVSSTSKALRHVSGSPVPALPAPGLPVHPLVGAPQLLLDPAVARGQPRHLPEVVRAELDHSGEKEHFLDSKTFS